MTTSAEGPAGEPWDEADSETFLDQLQWLGEAGLVKVDVYWMKAGHAIFGGRKPDQPVERSPGAATSTASPGRAIM